MKKLYALIVVVALVLAASPAWAQGSSSSLADQPPIQKLGRGFMNILDAPVEIPGTMIRQSEEKGAAKGMFEGFFFGAVNTVKRAAVGVYEVVTFPFPIPEGYEPILDEPKFLSKE